jgi:vitamin B12 transporter
MKLLKILTCFLALTPVTAAAQTTDSTDTVRLDEIVITATRVPVAANTVSKTVVTRDQLQEMGIVQVQDAIRLASAAVLQSGSFGGVTSLFLRGGESGYTRILVDGVPVNEPGGSFNLAHLLTGDVERIEIVKGPTSVLYGTDAVSGVIQIFTRQGTRETRASIDARAGNYGSYSVGANVTGSGPEVDYGFSMGQYRTDGIYEFNNSYRNSYFSGKVGVRPDELTSLRVSLRQSDNRYATPTDGSGNIVDTNAFEFGESSSFGLEAKRSVSSNVEVQLTLANLVKDGGFDDIADNAADTLGFFGFRSLDKIVRRSAEGRVNYYLPSGLVATLGGQVEQEKQRSFNESASQFGVSNDLVDVARWNRAGYAQLAGNIESLSLQLGGRFDHNEAFGDFFTYRAGLAYKIADGTSFRGAIGTAFREPTFFQNFASGFVVGNPDLDPERTTSWELGLDQVLLNGRVELNVTWYDQSFDDLIEYTFSPPNPGDPNYFNIAGATARGIELNGTARIGSGFSFRGSYTFTDTEVTQQGFDVSAVGLFAPGESLLRRPRHTASVTGGFSNPRGSVHLTANYLGARSDLDFSIFDRIELESYTTVDLAANIELLDRGGRTLTLQTRIANALDKEYQTIRGFASPGRNFLVGFTLGL